MAGIRTQDCEPEHKPFSPAFIVMFRRLWGFIPGEGRWGQICCWPLLSHISLSHHSGACGKGREQARVLRGCWRNRACSKPATAIGALMMVSGSRATSPRIRPGTPGALGEPSLCSWAVLPSL